MTTFRRSQLQDFVLANPVYANSEVTVYGVLAGVKDTTNLVTLYDAETGVGTLTNPQKLDSDGKFPQPVYVLEPVIMQVTGARVADHDTGIVRPDLDDADLARAEHAAIQALGGAAVAESARKKAAASAAAAAASAASNDDQQTVLLAQSFA